MHGQMTINSWTTRTFDVFRGTHGLVSEFIKLTEDPSSQALGHSGSLTPQQLAGGRQPLFPAVARFAKFKLPSSRPDSGPGAESYMRTVASWGWGQRRGQREDNAGLWLVATDHVTCTLTWDWSIAGDGRELSDGRAQQRLHLRHLRRGLLRRRGNLLLPDLPPGDARSDGLWLGLLQVIVTQKCGGKIYLSSHLKWITLPDRIRISMWIWWKTWSWLHVEFRDRNPNSVWMCKFTIRSFVNTDSSVATRLWCY